MSEREQFEAWHRNRWPTVDLDGLASHQVHARWEAWQARAALSQQQAEPVPALTPTNPRVPPETQDAIKGALLRRYSGTGRTDRLLFEAADCIGSLQFDLIDAARTHIRSLIDRLDGPRLLDQATIIRLANEAGLGGCMYVEIEVERLQRFAELVRKA